jgi:hypothetical protein
MSDDDYDIMYSDGDGGSGDAQSGGSGGGSQPDPEAELENKYFEAKGRFFNFLLITLFKFLFCLETYEENKEKGLKGFHEVLDIAVKMGEGTDAEKPW